ncbi:dTMP kinase [Pseudomonas sp. GL-B-26]|uniref:dTMP kinase n=1 Tax=Pseudomonas sp. GL-B-26 TaxID=2832394 RepID=UPI001CBAA79F|nr:AAA family ATPase [Pseudomonas sp. GL-B-26]
MAGFVAIEGLDGVGKSTVLNRLAELLSGHAMSTPGPALRSSRQTILKAFAHDELAKALFYTASVSSEGRQARRLADRGEWVFMDRYWASTLAYAKARGVSADLEALGKSLIQPDITILLLLDEQERQKRLHARGATAEDLETLDPNFRQCVLSELNARADIVIDITDLDVTGVSKKLTQAIEGYCL